MRLWSFAIILAVLLQPAAALAGGACPTRANNLEAFAHCMVPLKGTVGTAAVYSSGQYDESARRLMQAMARGNMTPPHVVPVSVGAYPSYAAFSPYLRVGSAYIYGYVGANMPYVANPYIFGYRR